MSIHFKRFYNICSRSGLYWWQWPSTWKCEAAWAASKTHNTYLSQKYYQMRARKGGKKAQPFY